MAGCLSPLSNGYVPGALPCGDCNFDVSIYHYLAANGFDSGTLPNLTLSGYRVRVYV